MSPRRSVISATEAAKAFGTLVDRVREERAIYTIERSGVPVAEIAPVSARCTLADLTDLLRPAGRFDEAYLRSVEKGVEAANKPVVPRDPWKS